MTPLFSITLPLPERELSPNARVHHMTRAASRKRARAAARLAMLHQHRDLRSMSKTPTHYAIDWHYKGIKPDADNVLASCKSALDGIADYIGVNDRDLEVLSISRTHNKTNPHLEITFY